MGIISTEPGLLIGNGTLGEENTILALVGRVPVKVSTINGPLKAGEPITSSEIPGFGMKSTRAGPIVGKALEELDPENGKGEVIKCPEGAPEGVKCGRILAFVNLSWFDPAASKLAVNENGDITIAGNLGIGTTGPAFNLEIAHATNPTLYLSESGAAADVKNWKMNVFQTDLLFQEFNDADAFIRTVLTLERGGNVGIGEVAPGARLDVEGSDSLNTTLAGHIRGATGTGLVITNAGNVGIGTTEPQAALDVAGGIKLGNYTTAGRPTCSTSTKGMLIFDTDKGKPYVCNGSIYKPLDSDGDEDGYVTGDGTIANGPLAGQSWDCDDSSVSIGYATDGTCDGDSDGYIDTSAGGNDYNDSDALVYPGTTCNGDCSVNNTDGTCGAKAAGENGLAVCQTCNGSSLTHVNIATFNDSEGSNTCAGTCAAYCSSGSCINLDTDNATCTVATNARVASGGDGKCTNSTCSIFIKENGEICSADSECISTYCYVDADGDRYAPASGTKTCRASSQIAGTDCYDSNANAKPGQTNYYTTNRGDGSYDYDCNGTADKYPNWNCVAGAALGCTSTRPTWQNGFVGSVPNCGSWQGWRYCRYYDTLGCTGGNNAFDSCQADACKSFAWTVSWGIGEWWLQQKCR